VLIDALLNAGLARGLHSQKICNYFRLAASGLGAKDIRTKTYLHLMWDFALSYSD